MKSAFLFGAVMFMATMASACPGRAAGAVALGLPSDVAKEGVSIFTQAHIGRGKNQRARGLQIERIPDGEGFVQDRRHLPEPVRCGSA